MQFVSSMIFRCSVSVGALCLAFFLFQPASAAAQQETVKIMGLTLPCDGCTVSGEPCTVLEPTLGAGPVACEEALPSLLDQVIRSGYQGTNPTLLEARDFLFSVEGAAESKKLLLRLLVETRAGTELIRREAPLFLRTFPAQLSDLLLQGFGSRELAAALRHTAESSGIVLSPEFLAVLVVRDSNLSLDSLFQRLKGRTEEPVGTLTSVAKVYRVRGQLGISEQLEQAARVLRRCKRELASCSKSDFTGYPGTLGEYLELSWEGFMLEELRALQGDPNALFDRLRRVGVEQVRKERFKELLVTAIRQVHGSHLPGVRSRALRDDNVALIAAVSRSDEQVAYLAANLLAKTAQEEADRGQPENCLALLRLSFELFPADLDERSRIVLDLHSNAAIRTNPRYSAQFQRIVTGEPRRMPALPGIPSSEENPWTVPLLIACFVVLSVLVFFIMMLRNSSGEEEEDSPDAEHGLKKWRAERERRELIRYFNLPEHPTPDQLTRRYRELLAQAQHSVGSAEAAEIGKQFKRAQEVLFGQ